MYYRNEKRINKGLVESFMVTLAHQSKLIPNLSQLSAPLEVLLRMDSSEQYQEDKNPLWTKAATEAALQ